MTLRESRILARLESRFWFARLKEDSRASPSPLIQLTSQMVHSPWKKKKIYTQIKAVALLLCPTAVPRTKQILFPLLLLQAHGE